MSRNDDDNENLPLSASENAQQVRIRMDEQGLATMPTSTVVKAFADTVKRVGDLPALHMKRPTKKQAENLVKTNLDLEAPPHKFAKLPQSENDEELEIPKASATKHQQQEGGLHGLLLRLDERVNVKLLMRLWGPRLEFVLRLMLVATFLEDSFSTAFHFSEHTKQLGEEGFLRFLDGSSGLVGILATIVLIVGLMAQFLASVCLLALVKTDVATKALIIWTIAQPVLFAQMSNLDFITESISVVGGLLMLRARLISTEAQHGNGARTQLCGRLLLPVPHVYQAGVFLFAALNLDETSNFANYFASLSMFVVNAVMLAGLAIGSAFVAVGLKSRAIALLLAIVNIGFIFWQHPFFKYTWFENGEWKYDADNMPMPSVALPSDVSLGDMEPWIIYDLHKYYFFLGLSTSGALLLLAQLGPGEFAVQQNELLLPVVARAQD